MSIFEDLLSQYNLETTDDVINASRELMQEFALAGLYRGGFFDKAAFYGGTCLRIFHGLKRFSEDMDFSLLNKNLNFSLEPYFEAIHKEFDAIGLDISISVKQKIINSNIESAFLKQNSPIFDISMNSNKNIKIKFEVDLDPPMGFNTESRLLLQPFSFFVQTYSLPDLYAGKMHALLYRNWKNRIKGRDWYDFEWYVRNNVKLNLNHFAKRAFQSGHINSGNISEENFKSILLRKITNLDVKMAKADVMNFIESPDTLSIWSKEYFMQLAKMIKFE